MSPRFVARKIPEMNLATQRKFYTKDTPICCHHVFNSPIVTMLKKLQVSVREIVLNMEYLQFSVTKELHTRQVSGLRLKIG